MHVLCEGRVRNVGKRDARKVVIQAIIAGPESAPFRVLRRDTAFAFAMQIIEAPAEKRPETWKTFTDIAQNRPVGSFPAVDLIDYLAAGAEADFSMDFQPGQYVILNPDGTFGDPDWFNGGYSEFQLKLLFYTSDMGAVEDQALEAIKAGRFRFDIEFTDARQ